jgi:hypothetical protein
MTARVEPGRREPPEQTFLGRRALYDDGGAGQVQRAEGKRLCKEWRKQMTPAPALGGEGLRGEMLWVTIDTYGRQTESRA